MARQSLLYLDNCVFSDMLEVGGAELKAFFLHGPHRIAFSHVHVLEMQSRPECYAELLTNLDAVFLDNPGAGLNLPYSIVSLEPGIPYQRFASQQDFCEAFRAFDLMLAPFHHLMGGRREEDLAQIVDATNEKITAALLAMLASADAGPLDEVSVLLDALIRDSGEGMKSLDPSDGWSMIDAQRKSAREGDHMRHMKPIEKVEHL